jgi:deazaflavin-dependent oxidoreductase (nitroreductase family)
MTIGAMVAETQRESDPVLSRDRALSRTERLALWLHRELDRRLTPLGVQVFRRTRGAIARPWGVDALLLTTVGRRSGRERTVVLQWFRDPAGPIIVGANDGGATDPAWVLNLRARRDARAEIAGRPFAVRAVELGAADAAEQWARILRRAPDYARYARATARTFPVFRLVPLDGAWDAAAGAPGSDTVGRSAAGPASLAPAAPAVEGRAGRIGTVLVATIIIVALLAVHRALGRRLGRR